MKGWHKALLMGLTLFYGMSSVVSAKIVDRIVAKVNESIITLSDVKREAKVLRLENPKRFGNLNINDPRTLKFFLDQMISTILIENELGKMGRGVTSKEVDAAYEAIKQKNHMTDAQFKAFLRRKGLTLEEYRIALKQRIERMRFFNMVIKSHVTISDGEVKAYYEKHKDEFGGEEKVDIAQIFVPVPKEATKEERLSRQNLIMKIQGELFKGKDFFAVIKKYKRDPRVRGYEDMGWFKRKDLMKPIADVAFRLKKGAVSDIIETKVGFHIIKVLGIQKIKAQDYEQVRSKIENFLFKQKSEERLEEWLRETKKQANVQIML